MELSIIKKLKQWWTLRSDTERLLLFLIFIFLIGVLLRGEVVLEKAKTSFNYYFSK